MQSRIHYGARNTYTPHKSRRTHARNHSADDAEPFFMYLAIQNVHSPYTLPPAWETHEYPAMWDKTYANMVCAHNRVQVKVSCHFVFFVSIFLFFSF
jgi:hypothetical protein